MAFLQRHFFSKNKCIKAVFYVLHRQVYIFQISITENQIIQYLQTIPFLNRGELVD